MKKIVLALALVAATQANAAVVTFDLNDIGTFDGYSTNNSALTFTGTGFVGMYSYGWAHLFGMESTYSRTVAQVNVNALAGKKINNASLSFDLLDGNTGTQAATFTGFDGGDGNLSFSYAAPATNYGSVTSQVGHGNNVIDITGLLASSVAANNTWLGLHLQGSTLYQWTYSSSYFGYASDRANVQLTVDFDEAAAVPEPGSLALLGMGVLGFVAARRKAKKSA